MAKPSSTDIAFTPSVKAVQERKGSRRGNYKVEERGGWETTVTPELISFLAERNSAYLATANSKGQPNVQHRGGPRGFIRVVDDRTLGFADYTGNKQYITLGNLAENDQALFFLMDYAHRKRVKIWGRAKVVENDPELIAKLMPEEANPADPYATKPEQAIIFTIAAWDVNCPQHIPMKVDAADIAPVIERFEQRIAELEAENARLKEALKSK